MVEFVGLGPDYETCDVELINWLAVEHEIKPDCKMTIRYKGSTYAMWAYDVCEKLIRALNEWEDAKGNHVRYQYKSGIEVPWDKN